MLRQVLLAIADQPAMRRLVAEHDVGRALAWRFVAGETLNEVIEVVRRLERRGLTATVNHLGEHVADPATAARAADAYLAALDRLHQAGVAAHVSLKPTHTGLDLGEQVCGANVRRVVAHARELGSFVRLDMEGSAYTDRTLNLFRALQAEFGDCVGEVLQAYLYRTGRDVEELLARRARIRLCKGAYAEPPSVAFPRKADTDRNFMRLTEKLLTRGNYPAIATHDRRIIEQTKVFAADRGISGDSFEFQMLYGIRRDLQDELVAAGYRVRLYVPYGQNWYPYLTRRLAERPANLLFVLRSLAAEGRR